MKCELCDVRSSILIQNDPALRARGPVEASKCAAHGAIAHALAAGAHSVPKNSSGALIAVDSELAYVRALHRPSDAAAATVPP